MVINYNTNSKNVIGRPDYRGLGVKTVRFRADVANNYKKL